MKTAYKTMIILLLLFSIGHMMYTFLENPGSLEQQTWFFSASLGMLGSVFLNVLNLSSIEKSVKVMAMLMNLMMFLFCSFLCFVVTEIQVLVLTAIYLITLFFSVRLFLLTREITLTK